MKLESYEASDSLQPNIRGHDEVYKKLVTGHSMLDDSIHEYFELPTYMP